MTTLTVLGPNGINDATFHVHAADCSDISKPKYRSAVRDGRWETDAATVQEVVEELFSDFIGTGETQHDDGTLTTWEDYASEVRIFPCTGLHAPEKSGRTHVHGDAVPTNGVKAPKPESGEVRVRIGTPFQAVLLSAKALPVPVKAVADKTAAAHAYKDGSRVVTLSRTEATALRKYAEKSDHRSAKAVARALP